MPLYCVWYSHLVCFVSLLKWTQIYACISTSANSCFSKVRLKILWLKILNWTLQLCSSGIWHHLSPCRLIQFHRSCVPRLLLSSSDSKLPSLITSIRLWNETTKQFIQITKPADWCSVNTNEFGHPKYFSSLSSRSFLLHCVISITLGSICCFFICE